MPSKRTIAPERFSELRHMYERGDRLGEIAAAFGVTAKTLREIITDLKLPDRMVKRAPAERSTLSEAEIRDLLSAYSDAGISVQSLLARFKIPLSRLYVELQRAGHPRRKAMPAVTSALSSDVRSRITQTYAAGAKTLREIAAFEGLNYDQVYVVLREAGVPLRTEGKSVDRHDESVRVRFEKLYADNSMSIAQIVLELGLTQHDVKALVKELRLQPRGKGGGRRSIDQSIIEMMPTYARRYEAGESMAKLAAEAGIGLATMKVRLKRFRQD